MATPEELRVERERALTELTLRLGRLSSHELDMVNSSQVGAAVHGYQERLRRIEQMESAISLDRAASAERAAEYQRSLYGTGGQHAGQTPLRTEEALIEQTMREMRARGLGRI